MIARQAKDGRGAQFRVFQAEACKQFVIAFSSKALQQKMLFKAWENCRNEANLKNVSENIDKLVFAKVRKFLTL